MLSGGRLTAISHAVWWKINSNQSCCLVEDNSNQSCCLVEDNSNQAVMQSDGKNGSNGGSFIVST